MLWYIMLKIVGENRHVISIEQGKVASDEYCVWDDIADGNTPPTDINLENPWTDSRAYDIRRKREFEKELPMLREEAKGLMWQGVSEADAEAPAKAAWNGIRDRHLKPWADVTLNSGTDIFTHVGHTLSDDDMVEHQGGTLPPELAALTQYYVVQKAGDTYKLSDTQGGAAKDFSADGSGIQYRRRYV